MDKIPGPSLDCGVSGPSILIESTYSTLYSVKYCAIIIAKLVLYM